MSCRVLFVIDSLFPLGDAYQMFLLAKELLADGSNRQQFQIAVLDAKPSVETEAISQSSWLIGGAIGGLEVHYLGVAEKSVRERFVASGRLSRLIADLRPTVVHAFGLPATMALLRLTGRHRSTENPPAARLVSTLTERPRPVGTIGNWLQKRVWKKLDAIIVATEDSKQQWASRTPLGQKIVVIPNAAASPGNIDTVKIKQDLCNRLGVSDTAFLAGTVADLRPVTRLKDVIWAADLLQCLDRDIHLVIFGQGEQRQRLMRFAELADIDTNIHFVGCDPAADTILAALDVYWHSHLENPMPAPLLAAMASELPVITVYGNGTTELVQHQATGFAVNFGARDEFARWTKFYIERPVEAKQIAAQGREEVLRKFAASEMADRYRAVYEI